MVDIVARLQRNTASHMAACVSGIMSSLILYSILQARLVVNLTERRQWEF